MSKEIDNDFSDSVDEYLKALAKEITDKGSEYLSGVTATKAEAYDKLADQAYSDAQVARRLADRFADKAMQEQNFGKAEFYKNISGQLEEVMESKQGQSSQAWLSSERFLKGSEALKHFGPIGDGIDIADGVFAIKEGRYDDLGKLSSGVLGGIVLSTLTLAFLATAPVSGLFVLSASVFAGFLGGIAGEWWWDNLVSPNVNNSYNSALNFVPRVDPLTLDLNGNGIETVSANAGIVFDFNGDGIKTGTGWIKGSDGFLVRDLDGNGTIDNGSELFGVDTIKSDGTKALDGFDALRDLDSNGDGVFDAQDEHFSSVMVWQDLNQDGVSQANELKSLLDSNIASINLEAKSSWKISNDNLISAVGSFTRLDGTDGELNGNQSLAANLDLASNPFYREYTDRIELSEDVAALPGMRGSGAVRDLQEAAMLNDGLRLALAQYSQATTRDEQLALLDTLLAEWAGSSDFRTFDQQANDLNTTVGQLDVEFEFAYSWDKPGNSTTPTAKQLEQKALLEKIKILEVFNGQNFFSYARQEATNEGDIALVFSSGAISRSTTVKLTGAESGTHTQYITEQDLTLSGQTSFLNNSYEALRQSVYDGLLLQTRLKPYMEVIELTLNDEGVGFGFSQVDELFQTGYENAPAEAVRDLLDLQRVRGLELSALGWEGLGQLNQWLTEAQGGPNEALALAALADFGYSGIRLDGEGGKGNYVFINDDKGGVLQGAGGNDLILGGDGDDILSGGAGDDILYGGLGNDTYRYELGGGHDTIIEARGDSGTDTLLFGEGIRPGDISISKEGNNLLFRIGSTGSISIANWFNSLNDEAHRLDIVRFADGRSFNLADLQLATGETATLESLLGNGILIGDAGENTLLGSDGDDWLDGGTNNDIMQGGKGDDTYVVDSVDDVVIEHADEGIDTVESNVSYTLGDNVENLTLLGYKNLSGTGNELDNIIRGNSGDNYLDGGTGEDTLIGGRGNDTYVVNSAGDQVIERMQYRSAWKCWHKAITSNEVPLSL